MDDNKCLKCELSNFGNLYYKRADLEGGELHVLEKSIERKKLLPCRLTYPLDPSLGLWKEVYGSLGKKFAIEELDVDEILNTPPIIYFTWKSFFDLKASAFLALAAHYRSATQLLRPILENIIVSRYFQERGRITNNNKWKKEYEEFLNLPKKSMTFYHYLGCLKSDRIIFEKGEEAKRIDELWQNLNKYLHSHASKWDKGNTPEVVRYNEGSLNEWLDLYQNILSYIIEMLCRYFPEAIKTQNGQNAFIELKGMEDIENDLKISLIKSKYLRNFLSRISQEGKLLPETGLPLSLLDLPYSEDS